MWIYSLGGIDHPPRLEPGIWICGSALLGVVWDKGCIVLSTPLCGPAQHFRRIKKTKLLGFAYNFNSVTLLLLLILINFFVCPLLLYIHQIEDEKSVFIV